MGNKTTKTHQLIEYSSVNSTKNDTLFDNSPVKTIHEKSDNNIMLEKLISDVNKAKTKEDIVEIFSLNQSDVIDDFYCSDELINLLKMNNSKSDLLAMLLPKSERDLIRKYFNSSVPYQILLLMGKNLDYNILNENGNTFLYATWNNNIPYVIELIKNISDININHINKIGMTFLMEKANFVIPDSKLKQFIKLIKLLAQKKVYNFNVLNICGNSILSILLSSNGNSNFSFSRLISIEEYDITIECNWLHILIANHQKNKIHNYLHFMLNRSDYKRLIHNLFNIYHYTSCENDFMYLLQECDRMNNTKTRETLQYTDLDGNTIIHLMAKRQCKKLLKFTLDHFNNLDIKENKNGKMPFDIYMENTIKNKLKMLSNK